MTVSPFRVLARLALCAICFGGSARAFELPPGKTLADLGLGPVPVGSAERAVRIVPWASLPGDVQQGAARGDRLYFAVISGQVWEYDLQGNRGDEPFLDVAAIRPAFATRSPSGGMRALAFHPAFESNGLFYTVHQEAVGSGRAPDYNIANRVNEFVLAEWNFKEPAGGVPSFREVLRVAFAHTDHNAQQIAFNPQARPGDADYGKLYLCFADNGNAPNATERHDPFDVGQDFLSIHSSVVRIHPLDPSSKSDPQLAALGLMRSSNGRFSIPLDNPFVGDPTRLDEIYAKGFRNPLSLSFSPDGTPIVADIGQQGFEELNLIKPGANYGWGIREGYFVTAYANQTDGAFLGADASQRYVPFGDASEPAESFFLRNPDGTNPRQQTLARTGPHADGITYPIAHFSHDDNQWNEQTAIVAGDYFAGRWAEELRGLYLFGNFGWDQIFYLPLSDLANTQRPAAIHQLPIVNAQGQAADFGDLLGSERGNFRFAKDTYGDLYIASKTSRMIYRLQGTPGPGVAAAVGGSAAGITLTFTRPGPDPVFQYTLERSFDGSTFEAVAATQYTVLSEVANPDGTQTLSLRYTGPASSGDTVFFRFRGARSPEL